MWAIVPLKSPHTAKSRLAEVLSPDARCELFFDLARRVIGALQASRGIAQVAVVTASDDAAHFAQGLGALVVRQARDLGTAQAFAHAIGQLQSLRLDRVLMMAADLPLATPQAIQTLIDAASRDDIVIVPDRLGLGTNALLCSPPGAITPCFGADSFRAHLAAARAARLSHRALHIEELALDIDLPADLEYLRSLQAPIRVQQQVPFTALAGDHA